MDSPIIYWFRQDLRLQDLPGLAAAAASGVPVIPCYILDDAAPGDWAPGAASRWWLHHSLAALAGEISELGGTLVLRSGDTRSHLEQLIADSGARAVYCSRQYEPWAAGLERELHQSLANEGVTFKRYPGTLIHEPEHISNQSGQPFRVFTPFWRKCRSVIPAPPGPALNAEVCWFDAPLDSDILEDWSLAPEDPDWAAHWPRWWRPGSGGAREKLRHFLEEGLDNYAEGRDHPALDCTTRLSPHLHFGEISPRQVWQTVLEAAVSAPALDQQVEKFLSELGWREFSHHLLHHFPDMSDQAFKPQFRQFPWIADEHKLRSWQRGQTGYPMVDAGMRELWQTGYMHNRVRMIVASFLTKHLLIHWRVGAKWFWDTLVDADLANNSCGWQWVAGSGADASPYFRIFNPVLQGKKFDVRGEYIRRWVPELKELPDRYLCRPWEAPEAVLLQAGVTLGDSYPHPLVQHEYAREAALSAYASL
jgi:deoxyribodipyrimidine photo-lyase